MFSIYNIQERNKSLNNDQILKRQLKVEGAYAKNVLCVS